MQATQFMCRTCLKQSRVAHLFTKHSGRPGGRDSECKVCHRYRDQDLRIERRKLWNRLGVRPLNATRYSPAVVLRSVLRGEGRKA